MAGYFKHDGETGKAIALGVENLSTWAHELCHAADLRCGNLKAEHGQELTNEVVAELGGATLLTIIGKPVDADVGGAFQYVKAYCDKHEKQVGRVCMQLLNRLCDAVALILDTGADLQAANVKAVA